MEITAQSTLSTSRSHSVPLSERAEAAAKEYEGTFIQVMLQSMFSGIGNEGPLGGDEAGGAWRGLLLEKYGQEIADNGGIGLADSVRREMIAMQERAHQH